MKFLWKFLQALFIRPIVRRNVLVHNASISGISMLLFARNVIQKLVIAGSSGTFTLTFQGQQTAGIAWNAATSAVQSALEALSNIDAGDVEVIGTVTGTMYVEFKVQWAAQNILIMTGANATGDAAVTITKIRNDVQKLTFANGSAGETYKLTYRAQTTAAIAFDATPAQIKTALELLSTIDTVTVTGTANSDIYVEFSGATISNMDNPAMTVSEESGDLTVTVTSPMPDTNLLGGQRSTTMSRTIDKADATNKDSDNWEESVPIIRHWSMSVPGFVVADETDTALEALKQAYINNLPLDVLLKMPSGNQYEGIAHLDNYDKEGPHDGVFTASLEVSGNGVLLKRT